MPDDRRLTEVRLDRFVRERVVPAVYPRSVALSLSSWDVPDEPVPAAEALAMGLVNEVVPRADLDAAVDRWAADVLACAPLSLRAIKQVVRRTAHMTAQEAQAARLPGLVEALRSADSEEGVRAFLEKRTPVWHGR